MVEISLDTLFVGGCSKSNVGSFIISGDAKIAKSKQLENAEILNENAETLVNSLEFINDIEDLNEMYVELDDDFCDEINATKGAKFATSPINIKVKYYDFSLDLARIAIVEGELFCGTE